MTIRLQSSIIYGPVRSRRLGYSLGVNLLSTAKKECSLNCLYCQYGWTPPFEVGSDRPETPAEEVIEAVEAALQILPAPPGYITFSGNGEPTLHPDFPGIVNEIVNLRDRWFPDVKLAVLSNSTTAGKPEIHGALARLDLRIMKLDVGREETFRRFNRPMMEDLDLETVVDSLTALDGVTIQALFAKGSKGNYLSSETEAWIDRLRRIQPTCVQIYSLARSYPSPHIEAVGREELEGIGHRLKEVEIESMVFLNVR